MAFFQRAALETYKALTLFNRKFLKVQIHITLKPGVLDPQGKAIEQSLSRIGFSQIGEVRQGKFLELIIKDETAEEAECTARSMCEKLLANTVIEDYSIEVVA